MIYCQDGIQVYFETHVTHGHYELQTSDINGRPYFKMKYFGLWFDGVDRWWIGLDSQKGESKGYAYYHKDVFCPHQLSELNWRIWDHSEWSDAGNDLRITCKCTFI